MKENTVTLSLEDYNYLRDYEKNTKVGKMRTIRQYRNMGVQSITYYYTESEAVAECEEINQKLLNDIASKEVGIEILKGDIDKLRADLQDSKDQVSELRRLRAANSYSYKEIAIRATLEDVKNFSILQFIKWRKQCK